MIMIIMTNVMLMMLPDVVVRLQVLKVSREPQSPVMHLYLASSSGSRDQDVVLLRKIVSLVSIVC